MAAEGSSSRSGQQKDASKNCIWQNERYYLGFGWYGPTILERPNYTNSEGAQVHPPWSVTSGGEWAVFVDSGTDLDGWQYSSGFDRFELSREGGRASMRLSDCVRRRRWMRVSELDAALGRLAHLESYRISDGHLPGSTPRMAVPDPSLGASPHTNAAVLGGGQSKGSLQRVDATMRAVKGFFQILHSALKDRGLWGMPLDPISYGILANRHAAASRQLQNLMIGCNKDDQESGKAKPGPWEACRLYLHRPDLRDFGSPEMDEYMKSLKVAGTFSRGAYGYPLRAGYLKSINSAVFMGTLKNLQFDVVGGASAEAHNKALLLETKTRESDLLLSEWKNSVCRPCHFVAVDRENQRLVIGIRGSLQPADILTDGMADALEVSLCGVTGYVHEGMFASATFVHCNTAEVLTGAAAKYPGWPLVVTGHSLGGGVAAILTMLLRQQGGCPESLKDSVQGFALGCPCVMSKELSDICAPFVTSLALRHDFVCRISAANVDLLMQELVAASPVRNFTDKIGGFFKRMAAAPASIDPMQPFGPAWVAQAFQTWASNAGMSAAPDDEGTEMQELASAAAAPAAAVLADIPPVPQQPQAGVRAAAAGVMESNHVCPTRHSPEGVGPEVHLSTAALSSLPDPVSPGNAPPLIASDPSGAPESEPHLGPQGVDGDATARQAQQSLDFGSSGIRVKGEVRRNLCPQGTGGTTSFDLLFPAGTVLWAVEEALEEAEEAQRTPDGTRAGVQPQASDSDEALEAFPRGQQLPVRPVVLPRPASSPGSVGSPGRNAPAEPSDFDEASAAAEPSLPLGSFFDVMERAWASSGPTSGESDPPGPSARSMPALSGGGEFPPGDSDEEYHGEEKTCTPMSELKWHPTFVRCPPEIFGRIYLHQEMINDHLPDHYAHAVHMLHTCYLAVKASMG